MKETRSEEIEMQEVPRTIEIIPATIMPISCPTEGAAT